MTPYTTAPTMATAVQMTIERVRDFVLTTPPLLRPPVGRIPYSADL
jgi:hypothetical protein